MDDAALRNRLARIERRQNLVLALLAGPYLFGLAELVGYWVAGVLVAVCGAVALVAVAYRRRTRGDKRA